MKSLAGESLREARLGADGLEGDRLVQVYDARGRVLTARTLPALLGLRGSLDEGGEPCVDGHPWTSPEAALAVRHAAGDGARLTRHAGVDRFDVLPILVATDGAVAALGVDRRRLRPNLVIGDVDGLAERTWPGRRLQVGEAILEVAQLRERCAMTTYDPDTQVRDPAVLRRIVREFDGTMALDCAVVRGGCLAVGDPVTLL